MALSALIGLAAWVVQLVEEAVIGLAIIEALVIAILLGTLIRTLWKPTPLFAPGISYTAKNVLEFAIVLLGASVSLPVLLQAGPALLVAIILLVAFGIVASLTIGRLMGLNPRLAILVAVGNSICGNSAIAAVAPVIGATADDIASSIAITAVIGVLMVLGLPLLIPVLQYSFYQYGVLAGMTVYAVPQVLAATFPVSTLSGQIGTLVKLVRVLMLGPVVIFFAFRSRSSQADKPKQGFSVGSIGKMVPWFIIGFILFATLRSTGLLPAELSEPIREISRWLTIAAMAALGLGVDIRAVSKVGRPVALAVIGSLISLLVVATILISVLGIK
jgi:uncharacterized integral membrane protein (TIGR00698 family)